MTKAPQQEVKKDLLRVYMLEDGTAQVVSKIENDFDKIAVYGAIISLMCGDDGFKEAICEAVHQFESNENVVRAVYEACRIPDLKRDE